MRESKLLALWQAVITALVVLSGSVAVPIVCRPFYYAHIAPLCLEEWGLTRAEICQAYDQMLDFCLGLRPDFAAGVLRFSADGASHFADVGVLFRLDLRVLGLSLAALAVTFVLCRKRKVKPYCFRGHGPGFWAAVGLGTAFLTVGGLAALDFERAFAVFHALFFPGKTNWLFDWRTDPIILFMPEEFFRNCAVLILALLLVWCAALIAADSWACKRKKTAAAARGTGCPGCCPPPQREKEREK